MYVVAGKRAHVAPAVIVANEIDRSMAEVALRASKRCSLLVGFGAIGDPNGGGYGVRGTVDSVRGPAPPHDHAQSVRGQDGGIEPNRPGRRGG